MHIHGCKQTPPTPPTTSDEESSGSSDDADTKKKKGNRAMLKKKYPKAVKYYTKAIKIDPANPTYCLNRAIANAALELWKDAEADASNAVRLGDPPSSKSHFQLARARLRRGQLKEARSAVDAALAAYPTESALVQLAKEIERARTEGEKQQRLQEQAKENRLPQADGPDSTRALLEQARSLYSAERIEEAIALLHGLTASASASTAVAREDVPRDTISAFALLGKAHMQKKSWIEAAAAFRRVIELEESSFSMNIREEREALSNAYNNLGIACKNGGHMTEAVDSLNSAYQRATNGDDQVATPQAAQILQNIAQCLRAQKKTRDAQTMYERALEIGQRIHGSDHASNALNQMCIARCLRDLGKIKEAVKSYAKAVEIWTHKDMETCLAEMPEVPSKDRLTQMQEQCCTELGQLLVVLEQARQNAPDALSPSSACS